MVGRSATRSVDAACPLAAEALVTLAVELVGELLAR
jgi:hypothetical protein